MNVCCLKTNSIYKLLFSIICNNFYSIYDLNNLYLTFNMEERDLELIDNSSKIFTIKKINKNKKDFKKL